MKSLDNKLIIYDSNCRLCCSLRRAVLTVTSLEETQIRGYKELEAGQRSAVDHAQFKNGMALLDLHGGETLYGAEGVAYILSSQYRLLDLLFVSKFFFTLFSFFYKIIAYNRYIIAPGRSGIHCDCLPDKSVGYRSIYILLTVACSVLLTLLFGVSLAVFFPGVAPGMTAVQMLLIAGTGWAVQILSALLLLRRGAADYIGHLGSIMVAGLLVLVPWIMLRQVFTPVAWFPAASVAVSSLLMLYMHLQRVKIAGLSQWWTVSWFVALQASALAWTWFFRFI